MKYCILMPKYTNLFDQAYFFPIGIAYVASSLRATGRDVISLNLNYKEGTTYELLKDFLMKHPVDVVATGGITPVYGILREVFESIKKINPKIVTCCGGGIITSDPVHGMKALEYVDYGIIGEGEQTIREWAEALEGQKAVNEVDGLIYREEGGSYKITAPRAECMDLDSLPWPDYEGFEYGALLDRAFVVDLFGSRQRQGLVSFSRSCPFNCTFCFHPSGTKYRKRSLKSIFSEIDFLIDTFHIENILVSDELFLNKVEDVRIFCEEIKKRNIGFGVELRVDMVNREMLQMLKDADCFEVLFGIESADDRILKSMRKHITVAQIERALQMCNEIGLNFMGNLIFGDQEETLETVRNSISWWEKHPEYNISLHMITVYPGSTLYNIACQRGVIKDRVQFIREGCPLVNISRLTDQEYKDLIVQTSILSRKSAERLENVRLSYAGSDRVDIFAPCPKCGDMNEWKEVSIFSNKKYQVCQTCGHAMLISASEYARETLRTNYERMHGEKIAFWPMTEAIGLLVQAIPELIHDENVFFIDTYKWGASYEGKVIQPPSILREENVGTVFLTTSSMASQQITGTIEREFPEVHHVFYAGALIDENFILRLACKEEHRNS